MRPGPALENLVASIAETCRSGLEPDALRVAALTRLRRAVPVDALWWAHADPSTLLFTRTHSEEIPATAGPYLVENEYLADDVNKWTEVAGDRRGARTLVGATRGEVSRSARYRDVFEPLGLEDELRVVLRSRDAVWGFMCLHRERGGAFSAAEVALAQRVAPHLADGIRLATLLQRAATSRGAPAPGLITLAPDGTPTGTNAAADAWLAELGAPGTRGLPIEVQALAARLRALPSSAAAPRVRVRTRAGRWAVMHASWLSGHGPGVVAVIVEQATPDETAPIVMAAYGLTGQERAVSGLVFQGRSTRAISDALGVTPNTVQDHLKAIFEKTGVRSRRELVATVLRQQYLPVAHGETGIRTHGP